MIIEGKCFLLWGLGGGFLSFFLGWFVFLFSGGFFPTKTIFFLPFKTEAAIYNAVNFV